MVSFQAVAYEYAVEMTYPVPEIMSSGLLNGLAQVTKQIIFIHVLYSVSAYLSSHMYVLYVDMCVFVHM